jgi:hypothetical protein
MFFGFYEGYFNQNRLKRLVKEHKDYTSEFDEITDLIERKKDLRIPIISLISTFNALIQSKGSICSLVARLKWLCTRSVIVGLQLKTTVN